MIERPESSQPLPPHAKRVFTGVLFDVYQWEQELFDGSTTTFEKLKRRDSAVIIPVLSNGKLLIAEDEQPGRPMKLTFPGGQIEDGEAPEEGARRELLEETGYSAERLTLWKATQPSTKVDWAIFTFIAHSCAKTAEPHPDPGERIALREVTLDEVIELARDPEFQNTDLTLELLQAKYEPEMRAQLEKKLFG